MRRTTPILGGLALAAVTALAANSHGDVAPQAVDTTGLPELGEEWLTENPYRAEAAGEEVWQAAIEIGSSGYNQNCARCHGLGAVSGGLAPDLRFLEAEEFGDEWYVERYRHGYTQNGTTKMPAFGELLGQEAGWAIRTYIETRPDEQMEGEFAEPLGRIRDELARWADDPNAVGEVDPIKVELDEIAEQIETLSGAPVADSIARRASAQLSNSDRPYKDASETLTVGMSAAQ